MPTGFPPVIDQYSQTLILGSMPSIQSLQRQQYYAHPRNHFWPILFAVYGNDPIDDYNTRLQWLLTQRLALWDVLASCHRSGSLDQNIRDEKPNSLPDLIQTHPRLQRILFNGTKAFDSFRRHIGFSAFYAMEFQKLPSTSPIPGRHIKTFSDKLFLWRQALLVR